VSDAEIRYRVTAALIQADAPLPLSALVEAAAAPEAEVVFVLEQLEAALQVTSAVLSASPERLYCWAVVEEARLRRDASAARGAAARAVDRDVEPREPAPDAGATATSRAIAAGLTGPPSPARPDLHGEPARRFCAYVVEKYQPPRGKDLLAVLQCSVRRPFSSSPSHASMRRAISAATGFDPARDFERCPVHAVVLASYVGPVPYELETVYPANVRADGVKRMGPAEYDRARPLLVERLAAYLEAHGQQYRGAAAFAESRYGEIVAAAAERSGCEVVLLPRPEGPVLRRLGQSTPRKYWEKYWIQLFLQIRDWLEPDQQAAADQRLTALDAEWSL